ncbi:MAG: hypothetical protein KKD67_03065 [Proteobacteria bacterium]|nr:hypothetical protein [Pseudomonadota bacterium]
MFIKALGLTSASFVLYVLSKTLFFLSIILFFRQFCKNTSIAFLAAVIISLHDMHYIFFDLNEAFLTPRIAAQSLSLFALRAVLQHRFAQTIVFLLSSALFHPIMAVGAGIIVCITWILHQEWRFMVFSAIILFACCFILFILHPAFFQNLNIMQAFDPQWRAIVLERAPYLFPDQWPTGEWKLIFTSMAVALISCFFLTKDPKKMVIAAIATLGLCLFLTFVFTYIFALSLPIQIQFWRAFWILRILNPLLCMVLVCTFWEKNNFWYQLAALMIIITSFMGGGIGSDDFFWIFPIIALCIMPPSWADRLGHKMKRLIFICVPGILLIIPLSTVLINIDQFPGQLRWLTGIPIVVHTIGPLFPILICLSFFYSYPHIPERLAAVVYLSFFIILCIPGVNPNTQYLSINESSQPLYKYHLQTMCEKDNQYLSIPPGSLVIPGEGISPSKVWFELRSACYWSWPQGAGVVFNRKLAIEYSQRQLKLKQMKTVGFCDKDIVFDLKKNPAIYVVSNEKLNQTKSSKSSNK